MHIKKCNITRSVVWPACLVSTEMPSRCCLMINAANRRKKNIRVKIQGQSHGRSKLCYALSMIVPASSPVNR